MPRRRAGRRAGRRGAVRGLALLLALLAWLAVAGVGGPLVGRLSEVQRNDNASFLPETAESTEVSELSAQFADDESLPFFVLVERDGGLTPADQEALAAFVEQVPDLAAGSGSGGPAVGELLTDQPVSAVPSQDGEAALVVVPLDTDAAERLVDGESAIYAVAEGLRQGIDELLATEGLEAYVTGPAGVLADFVTAFSGIDGRLLQVTLAVVFLILLLVYRSPVLPVAALLSALFALAAAGGVIYPLADSGVIDLNGQSQGILFILVVGAATDYALLLVSRYREELHDHDSKYAAMRVAWRGALEPIVASAATVVLGLLCLLLADLGSTAGLGPVGALGVTASMLSVLTFLPVLLLWPVILLVLILVGAAAGVGLAVGGVALAGSLAVVALVVLAVLGLLRRRASGEGRHRAGSHGDLARSRPWYARPPSGRWLFWPRMPRPDHVHPSELVAGDEARGLWSRVARLVGRRPRVVWLLTAGALAVLAAFAPTFDAEGTQQTDIFLDQVESVTGQEVLAEHFPAGSGSPALVLAPAEELDAARQVVSGTPGVESVAVTTDAPPGAPPGTGDPRVEGGLVELEATLEPAADSPQAEDVVADLRERLDAVSRDALVGGSTAANLDVRNASDRDLRVIVPSILVVIFVVLVLLLRSVVAPLLLVAANVLSFAATLGVSSLVFDHVLDLPGADPAIPLYGFVFLVALGIDYSIFLMTRVREESQRRGTRTGVLVGLAVTGGVITSAGVVLASTFGALATLPLLFLLQVAFIVAFGVLLDTLVVRSLLVPALCHDIGPRVWWPARLARQDGGGAR